VQRGQASRCSASRSRPVTIIAAPEARERLFGEPDYLLRIMTSDLAAYQRLQDDRLSVLPGVQRMTSTLVIKRIADDRPLPA
jgi:DNA-binding Lrp family transcriptional regulator